MEYFRKGTAVPDKHPCFAEILAILLIFRQTGETGVGGQGQGGSKRMRKKRQLLPLEGYTALLRNSKVSKADSSFQSGHFQSLSQPCHLVKLKLINMPHRYCDCCCCVKGETQIKAQLNNHWSLQTCHCASNHLYLLIFTTFKSIGVSHRDIFPYIQYIKHCTKS